MKNTTYSVYSCRGDVEHVTYFNDIDAARYTASHGVTIGLSDYAHVMDRRTGEMIAVYGRLNH